MRKMFFCIVLLFIFTGCKSTYTHPIKNAQDFDRDLRQCEKMTRHRASVIMDEEMNKCLKSAGWRQGDKD